MVKNARKFSKYFFPVCWRSVRQQRDLHTVHSNNGTIDECRSVQILNDIYIHLVDVYIFHATHKFLFRRVRWASAAAVAASPPINNCVCCYCLFYPSRFVCHCCYCYICIAATFSLTQLLRCATHEYSLCYDDDNDDERKNSFAFQCSRCEGDQRREILFSQNKKALKTKNKKIFLRVTSSVWASTNFFAISRVVKFHSSHTATRTLTGARKNYTIERFISLSQREDAKKCIYDCNKTKTQIVQPKRNKTQIIKKISLKRGLGATVNNKEKRGGKKALKIPEKLKRHKKQ